MSAFGASMVMFPKCYKRSDAYRIASLALLKKGRREPNCRPEAHAFG